MTNIETYSKEFEEVNKELKVYWDMGREAARNVGVKINELVEILFNEHPQWSVNKIAYTIAEANIDLEGFSSRTIYNHLNNDNKALLAPERGRPKKELQKNIIEQNLETIQSDVSEQSSRTIPTAYEVKEAEIIQEGNPPSHYQKLETQGG